MVGSTLAERYVLSESLAKGGMGSVYVATDTRLERRVAVKLMKEELTSDPRFVERFRREARAAAALSHPNIAGVFDYGEDAGRPFIVMELVAGRDLARLLREEGPLSEDRAARIAAQIGDALAHAHAAGLVHRDIKPANAIVSDDDRVKVTDFGIARAQADAALTATGAFLGTAQYISPEQASGAEVSPASDIYSLGIVLFEALTGSAPFTGDSPVAVAARHVSDNVPVPSSLRPGTSSTMDSVVARATAREPAERFANAAEFAAAVRGAVTGTETHEKATVPVAMPAASSTAVLSGDSATAVAEDWPFPAHPPRWEPRRLGRTVIAIFLVLLLVAAGLVVYRLLDRPDERRGRRTSTGAPAGAPATEGATMVEVPSLEGQTYEDAAAELEGLGLVPRRTEQENDEYEAGVVFASEPVAGTEVEEGTTVTLFVSGGPPEEDDDEEDDGNEGEGILTDSFTPPGQEKKDDKEGKD